ncbi:MAG: nuclear transport factor 2 family protein [Acidobacteriota bacterium]
MATPEQINEIVAAYFAATRAMDKAAWLATFAEDGVSIDPVGAPPMDTNEKRAAFFDGIVGAFETVGLSEQEIYLADNSAAVKWTGQGTGKNGREVSFAGIDVFEINDQGKIHSIRGYWNPAAMMAELLG